ncbi:cytochrome P450 [Xylariales sp. PMI_506]|nr:cytochrome P450 [Xylariales sp. PMI_506]
MALQLVHIAVAALALVLLQRVYTYVRLRSSLPLPPGPPPLPLIGNVHQAPTSKSWLQFYTWGKEYGPLVYLNMLGQSVIILSTNQAAQDLLSRRGAHYSDRPRLVVAGEIATRGLHILLRPYDAQYKLHQRLQAPLLSPRAASSYRPIQDLESRQLLSDLLAGFDASGDHGVDFNRWFERTASSIIYCLVYGFRLKTGLEQELVNVKHVQVEANKSIRIGAHLVDSFPILNVLPAPLAPWKKQGEKVWQLERSLHLGNLERGLASPAWNFSKHMKASKEAQGMSDEELAFDLGVLTDAALDTTTMSLDWLIPAWVTQDRGWVSKAQKLLDGVVGRDRLPQFEDRADLVYIDAIVMEVLRWRPVVVGGVPHRTRTADEYMGYRIPADSVVIANHWAITRDVSVYGAAPDEFRPERWLVETGDPQDPEKIRLELKDMPATGFGFGRRACTGHHIARNTLFLTFARLLWAFEVEIAVDPKTHEKIPVDPMASTDAFSVRPAPFNAFFRPRGDWARWVIEAGGSTHGVDIGKILDQVAADRTFKS